MEPVAVTGLVQLLAFYRNKLVFYATCPQDPNHGCQGTRVPSTGMSASLNSYINVMIPYVSGNRGSRLRQVAGRLQLTESGSKSRLWLTESVHVVGQLTVLLLCLFLFIAGHRFIGRALVL